MQSPLRHRLSILGAAALFSTGGAAIKACGMTGWQVASFRSGVAAIALALLLPRARRGWSWRTLVVGMAYAATMILFVLGNKLTTAANTIFLQSTAPLYLLLLAPLVLKEAVRRRDLLFMLIIAAGLGMFFVDVEPATRSAPNPFVGNLLGTASGLSWALTLLGLRWLDRSEATEEQRGSGLAAVVVGNLLACGLALPLALPVEAAGAVDWAMIAYLGVIQIGLAYVLLTHGFQRVPAFEASLLILLEPTLNPVWAWLFQGEVPGRWALAGGVTIFGASIGKSWLEQRGKRLAQSPQPQRPSARRSSPLPDSGGHQK